MAIAGEQVEDPGYRTFRVAGVGPRCRGWERFGGIGLIRGVVSACRRRVGLLIRRFPPDSNSCPASARKRVIGRFVLLGLVPGVVVGSGLGGLALLEVLCRRVVGVSAS